jgi:hypothetical protein
MTVVEQTGWWWLPGRGDRKVPGVLTFDPKHGGRLILVGALIEVEEVATAVTEDGVTSIEIGEEDLEAAGTYDRVVGVADRKPVTLEQCIEIHRSGGFFGGTTKQVIHAGRVLYGAGFETGETGGNEPFRVTVAAR